MRVFFIRKRCKRIVFLKYLHFSLLKQQKSSKIASAKTPFSDILNRQNMTFYHKI